MASNTCLRRIAGAPQVIQSPFAVQAVAFRPAHAAPFSTSAALFAAPPKGKTSASGPPKRGEKALRLKKSGSRKTDYKRPAIGERKALRKRIVLSNTNALEVVGLEDINAENLAKAEINGKVLGIPGPVVDSLRAVDAFKPRQGWYYFSRPATLMRNETLELAKLVNEVSKEKGSKTSRRIITGERLGGKSTLLLQGLAMAFVKGWVVINLPDAMEIVNGHTQYAPLEDSNPVRYIQSDYTAQLLTQISKANATVLSKIPLSKNYGVPIRDTGKLTLKDFAEFGGRNSEFAWQAFQGLWTELTQPDRPPIFFAVDGLAYLMKESAYKAPDMKNIHAQDLAIVEHFLSYLSGTRSLPNGGVVVAATSGSNQPASPALDYAIKSAEQRAAGVPKDQIPARDPYKKVDIRALDSLKDIDVLKVNGLNRDEAKSIMEYYAASGMLRAVVNENLVNEKWTISGGGNIGELERATVRMRV